MFRIFGKTEKKSVPLPPGGIGEIIICVFDEKGRLHHHFFSNLHASEADTRSQRADTTEQVFESLVMREAISTRLPASMTLFHGPGRRKFIYVFPYEFEQRKWRFACVQITSDRSDDHSSAAGWLHALAGKKACFVLIDGDGLIQSAGPEIVESFGYAGEVLAGMHLSDLFHDKDVQMLATSTGDTNVPIRNCVLHALDGSDRAVEIQKYTLSDQYVLLGLFDVTRPVINEDVASITARDRRRIGQDLHDSIGQLLTGISLLSRSLSNDLKFSGHSGETDAAQISELADDASNQIRQISRGLMPSDIIHQGFYASLHNLARITSDSCGIQCNVQLNDDVEVGDGIVETHLYRIAQEAVNNAVRHANASRIDIVMTHIDGAPELRICDDGTWRQPADTMSGIGMKSMKYRASVIGGQLKFNAGINSGTQVICRLATDDFLEAKA